jgi:cytidine deaminase
MCRQALYEFAPDLEVVMANTKGKIKKVKLKKLLAHPFSLNNH